VGVKRLVNLILAVSNQGIFYSMSGVESLVQSFPGKKAYVSSKHNIGPSF
jgi:hypothetical protein